jgi:hypothetical protein
MSNTPNTTNDDTPSPSEQQPSASAQIDTATSPFERNKAALFDALEASGITQVLLTFDGYGDSGQVENISAKKGDNNVEMPTATIERIDAGWCPSETIRSSSSVASAVETLAYDVLGMTHCNWPNDEGAYGDIVFDVAERAITLDYNERYLKTEYFTHVL